MLQLVRGKDSNSAFMTQGEVSCLKQVTRVPGSGVGASISLLCYRSGVSEPAHPQLPQPGPALLCFLGNMQGQFSHDAQ